MEKGIVTQNSKTIKWSIVYIPIFAFAILFSNQITVCSQKMALLQPQNLICQSDVFEIPNAFTPNNDGINDKWKPLYKDSIDNLKVKVYSKYGELVFEENNKIFVWDGMDKKERLCDAGSYLFIIDYVYKGHAHQCKGGVSLIR